MNKSEFIRKLADKQGVTIKEAESSFNALVDTLTDCLK
ncbi:MAG TPA: integration host factor subunit beta, partial [Clostridiales bacterium]|nr:integration host factor subunit beta [Clostridiales bacterium]